MMAAMEALGRLFVSRSCVVCEWRGQGVEHGRQPVECPWCHAPTRVTYEEVLTPVVAGKNPHAAALSRLGAARGGQVRAERLTRRRRQEIARAAAEARWRRR